MILPLCLGGALVGRVFEVRRLADGLGVPAALLPLLVALLGPQPVRRSPADGRK
jgi:hypothetical protein